MANKTKKVFPYEKEHKKDNGVCKMCGRNLGISSLIGGICKPCHSKSNMLGEKYRKGFVVRKENLETNL